MFWIAQSEDDSLTAALSRKSKAQKNHVPASEIMGNGKWHKLLSTP